MPGGLMNLIAEGNQNIILTGNPTKSFFKCTYAKYTNFGLQKFRIDYDGQRTLNMNATSNFKFKMPRTGGDLIMDTYLVVKLPTIWSPIMPPDKDNADNNTINKWRPYEFKWIKHLGSQMIERVRFTIGGQVIQEFTGQYLHNMIERDFDANKKELYYKMIGHVPELNDPANAHNRVNVYPNAYKMEDNSGPEPSIRSRSLYIPLNIWFTLASKMAFPIAALQYNEFNIEVDIRPVKEMYVIRHIPNNEDSGSYYHQSNFNESSEQFHRFIHPPPTAELLETDFTDTRTNWDTDIHLISTYAFLSEDEQRVFQLNEQSYLIKQVYTHTYNNLHGTNIIDIETRGMVSSWMWFLQRSDIAQRNQWSNYTNWPYDFLPYNVDTADDKIATKLIENYTDNSWNTVSNYLTPEYDFDYDYENDYIQYYPASIMISGKYYPENQKDIMETWGLLLDGKYRENTMDAGIFNYVEKYTRTAGNGPDGLYCYNFCLNNNVADFQPSGAINMSKFNKIQFEMGIITPPLDPSSQVDIVCNTDGDMIGIDKTRDSIFDYTYDLTVLEERYNVLTFSSGNAALSYAR
jgi:hypothetical protein